MVPSKVWVFYSWMIHLNCRGSANSWVHRTFYLLVHQGNKTRDFIFNLLLICVLVDIGSSVTGGVHKIQWLRSEISWKYEDQLITEAANPMSSPYYYTSHSYNLDRAPFPYWPIVLGPFICSDSCFIVVHSSGYNLDGPLHAPLAKGQWSSGPLHKAWLVNK